MSQKIKNKVYMAVVYTGGIDYELKMHTFKEIIDWLKDDKTLIEHKRLMLDKNPELKIYYEG